MPYPAASLEGLAENIEGLVFDDDNVDEEVNESNGGDDGANGTEGQPQQHRHHMIRHLPEENISILSCANREKPFSLIFAELQRK